MRAALVRERDNPRASARSGNAELGLVAFAYVAYSTLRLVVEGSRATAIEHAQTVLRIERALGLDWEGSAQESVLAHHAAISFWNFVYGWVYWPTVAITLVMLWRIDRGRYVLLRNTLLISAAAGLVIFGLYPVSPPRFLDGYVDTLAVEGDRFIAERSMFVNQYAAIPSFHVGWPAVAGVIIAWGSRRVAVWAAALTPALLLAPAVVFTGNHFVLDIVAGLAVAFASLAVASTISTGHAWTTRRGREYRSTARSTVSSSGQQRPAPSLEAPTLADLLVANLETTSPHARSDPLGRREDRSTPEGEGMSSARVTRLASATPPRN